MSSPLVGPNERYLLTIEALASQDGEHFTRYVAEAGIPLGTRGLATGEAPGAPPSAYLVMVDEACSLIIHPGENGLTVRDIRLLNACHLRLTARAKPGSNPPDWLTGEGCQLLFDGDAKSAYAMSPRYIPFDGMLAPEEWTGSDFAPLDQLMVAVGRSVERANTILACNPTLGGTALVTATTLRVGVARFDLAPSRVFITLPRNGQAADGQFVELTVQAGFAMTATPLEAGVAAEAEAGAATAAAELQGSVGVSAATTALGTAALAEVGLAGGIPGTALPFGTSGAAPGVGGTGPGAFGPGAPGLADKQK